MQTRTIPEEQWLSFFDVFSRHHAGWPVTIEVLDEQSGPQKVADGLPLTGISFDTKGSRPSAVQVGVGDRPGCSVNHVVDLPMYIREADEDDGSVDFQIEPAKGPVTLVHVRQPVH